MCLGNCAPFHVLVDFLPLANFTVICPKDYKMAEGEFSNVVDLMDACDEMAEDLGQVLEDLEVYKVDDFEDIVVNTDVEDIDNINFDGCVQGDPAVAKEEASLLMFDGTAIGCPQGVLNSSEYLSDMSKVSVNDTVRGGRGANLGDK